MSQVNRLTKSKVDNQKPQESRYFVWDGSMPGFGLVVQPTGAKTYVYQYRNVYGKTVRITIGRNGENLTADQARMKAKGYAAAILNGEDPAAEKRDRKEAFTVGELLDAFTESEQFAARAESTQKIDLGRIERHLKPLLGRKVAETLKPQDVRRAFKDIEEGKTAKQVKTRRHGLARVTGGPGAARMAIRLLKTAYAWAINPEQKLIKTNPTAGIKTGKDGSRDIVLSQSDYTALFQAIDKLGTEHKIRPPAADAIRVIALTGARKGEIAGLRWRHVNLKDGVIVLPFKEHKTGIKTQEPRVIGLPTAAQEIIANQPSGQPDEYVFPPTYGQGPLALSKPWRVIREAAGLNPQTGIHSLRHSLATSMAESGSQATHIMAVMGHRDLATSQRYIHIAQDKKADLAEHAAAGISAALSGREAAKVRKIEEGS